MQNQRYHHLLTFSVDSNLKDALSSIKKIRQQQKWVANNEESALAHSRHKSKWKKRAQSLSSNENRTAKAVGFQDDWV